MGDKPPFNYPRMPMQNKLNFTKLNPEPTDKWSVLKSDKFIYTKPQTRNRGQAPIPRVRQARTSILSYTQFKVSIC